MFKSESSAPQQTPLPMRRSPLRPHGVLLVTAGLAVFGGALAACGGGGSSISSSPGKAVTGLFSDIQANNCNASYALMSTRLQNQLGGKDKVCPLVTQLSVRYAGNTFRIDSVNTHGNQATVAATRTNPNGTRVSAQLSTVVENNTWKVDSLASTSPTTSSTSSTR